MIGYLRGEVLDNSDGKLLVLVPGGAAAGVGYSVSVPQSGGYASWLPGAAVELFIHTHVREDALDLYGFSSALEKELFLTLLGVNGVGPKVALAILSATEPAGLIQAIIDEDKATLTRIPGVGKKTAERLVLETSDRIRRKMETGAIISVKPEKASSVSAGKAGSPGAKGRAVSPQQVLFNDAKSALVGLGYRENDVAVLLNRVLAESEGPPPAAEELVRTALRQLL